MILIVLSWIVMLVICFLNGFLINKYFKLNANFSLVVIFGIILVVQLANVFAFFSAINLTFFLLVCLCSTVIYFIHLKEVNTLLKSYFTEIIVSKKILMLLISILVYAAYSSSYSNINDDGLYYIQTTMWLKKYGFVHGLSNLHVSLGLCSSWHVFQTVFSFTGKFNFNDVNGFLMLVFTFYLIENIISNKSNTIFYIQFIITLIISIPFYSAPNPDLAVILFTIIGLNLYINKSETDSKIILLMVVFAFTIKVSALVLFLLGFYVFVKNYSKISLKFYCLLFLIGGIHISKNIYQTAYPFYPFKIASLNLDWKTPEPIIDYYKNGIKTWAYSNKFKPQDVNAIKDKNSFEVAKLLLNREGAKGLINKIILIVFLGSLITFLLSFKRQLKENKECQMINGLSMVIWFLFSPQYRFAIPMIIFYSSFLLYSVIKNISLINTNLKYFHLFVLIVLVIPMLVGLKLNANETSTQIGTFTKLDLPQLVVPKPQYSFQKIDTIEVNKVKYYHVNNNVYCWNSPLPCMSANYQKVISENFKYIINTRKIDLKDGFYFSKN